MDFRLPRGIKGWVDAAMPGDHDAIHELRDNLAGHFPGFLDDLIQCESHVQKFAQAVRIYNLEAGERA